MQEIEIEKRFLVPEEKIEQIKSFIVPNSKVLMKDVYIPNGEDHKDLRLRQKGEKYMITRKRPIHDGDSTRMLETTIELSGYEFQALSEGIKSDVEKERYRVNIDKWGGELDIFTGRHSGLVVVEFEFQNEADLVDFEQNTKLDLIDITNIEWLAGGRLAEIDAEILTQRMAEYFRSNKYSADL